MALKHLLELSAGPGSRLSFAGVEVAKDLPPKGVATDRAENG